MHIHNQQNRFELNGLMQSHDAIGFQKTATILGYRNGLSVALKKMKSQAKKTLGFEQARCPDGEIHHPSVCLRGWRGDVCTNCQFMGN
ncbi:MAG: hypothetical protein HQL69_13380 [Magnetococcales bacterium]|nr:hypothetical protein [Magnetococcales bacterium]